jgi:hypothetical protein
MKLLKFLVYFTPLLLATFISPTTINGRFIVSNIDSSKLSILLQVNTDTGADDLGGATIVFSFDTTAISFTCNPVKDFDYFFHNFCGGNYSPATVTKPMNDKIWVNIDLPYTHTNNGTIIAKKPRWTDVVTIKFNIIDPSGTASLIWNKTSLFWGIYDADNSTLWETGVFQDLLDLTLPIELSSFSAKLMDGDVFLNWITKTEVNNFGFDIERKINESEWVKIGFVEGYGNSNSPKSYSFMDNNVIGGNIFNYRLKQIDTDGGYEYSGIVEIKIVPGNFAVYQNYPNPFNPTTKIRYQLPEANHVEIKIFNVLGSEVTTLLDDNKEPGIYEVEFSAKVGSASDGNTYILPSGIYIYRVVTGNSSTGSGNRSAETKKMVLMK